MFKFKKKDKFNLIDDIGLSKLKECEKHRQKLIRGRIEDDRDRVIETINLLASYWKHENSGLVPININKGFEDPVLQYIDLPIELRPIFSSPLVQRLNYINQLSFGYFAYPMGNHSRLAHCIGTLGLIRDALRKIFSKKFFYSKNGKVPMELSATTQNNSILLAQAAALLHDIGHGPFGHALDKYICFTFLDNSDEPGVYHLDKYYSPKYVKECLSEVIGKIKLDNNEFLDYEKIADLLGPDKSNLKGLDCLIAQLIDSPLDVDRIDYISRDSHACGLTQGLVNIEALLENMVAFKEDDLIHLAFREDAIPHIEHLLSARDIMYLHCYEHPSKVCADRLLEKALKQFIEDFQLQDDIENILLLTDQQLMTLMAIFAPLGSLCYKFILGLKRGLHFEEILSIPHKEKDGEENNDQHIKRGSVNSSRISDFRKKALKGFLREAYFDMPKIWEYDIADNSKVEPWQINIVCASHEVNLGKEDQTYILIPDGNGYKTEEIRSVSKILNEGYVDILRNARDRLRLFVYSGCTKEQKDTIMNFAKEYLLGDL